MCVNIWQLSSLLYTIISTIILIYWCVSSSWQYLTIVISRDHVVTISGAMHRQRPRELFPARGLLVRSKTQHEGPVYGIWWLGSCWVFTSSRKILVNLVILDDLDYFWLFLLCFQVAPDVRKVMWHCRQMSTAGGSLMFFVQQELNNQQDPSRSKK
jgi:hypothetical protein